MEKKRISKIFQNRLLICVIFAFLVTILLLWTLQTRMSEDNAANMLDINIKDVKQDILDNSDKNMLELSHKVADILDEAAVINTEILDNLCEEYNIAELNVINKQGK